MTPCRCGIHFLLTFSEYGRAPAARPTCSVMRPSQPAVRVWSRERRSSIGPQPPPIIDDTYLLPKTVDFGRPTRRVLPEIPQSAPDSRAPDLVDAPVRSSEGGVISLQRRSSRWFSACSYGSCPNAVFHGWESHRPTAPSSRSATGRRKGSGGHPPPTHGADLTIRGKKSHRPRCKQRGSTTRDAQRRWRRIRAHRPDCAGEVGPVPARRRVFFEAPRRFGVVTSASRAPQRRKAASGDRDGLCPSSGSLLQTYSQFGF